MNDSLIRPLFFIGIGLIVGLIYHFKPSNRFNQRKMFEYSVSAIAEFARTHKKETFYAFSIDATMLCLNSEDAFKKTLKRYRADDPKLYGLASEIDALRFNTGDWEYQGFTDLQESGGFDMKAYDFHYNRSAEKRLQTPYAKAMNRLLTDLKNANAFAPLNRSEGFSTTVSDHGY